MTKKLNRKNERLKISSFARKFSGVFLIFLLIFNIFDKIIYYNQNKNGIFKVEVQNAQ